MANPKAAVVHVETLPGRTFGETENSIRIWLRNHAIVPADFKITRTLGGLAFEIGFERTEEAARFLRRFPTSASVHGPAESVGFNIPVL